MGPGAVRRRWASWAADDAGLVTRWAEALAHVLGDTWTEPHPWKQFAAGRIATWLKKQPAAKAIAGADLLRNRPARTDLSAADGHHHRGAVDAGGAAARPRAAPAADAGPRTVAMADCKPPPLAAHPFAAMQAALPNPNGGAAEALAAATPAEFWYARVDDVRLLLRLLDEADTWITPVVQILQQNPEDRSLTARYQRQLGLRRSDLAKLFGHTVVGEVAIVGSDPYLREGTDVTLIFALKQAEVFDAELTRQLDGYRAEVAGDRGDHGEAGRGRGPARGRPERARSASTAPASATWRSCRTAPARSPACSRRPRARRPGWRTNLT